VSARPRAAALLASGAAFVAILLVGCDEMLARSPGERLWRKHCAECHGLDGRGNTPRFMGNNYADLLDDSWRSGTGDRGSLEAVVREGVFGQMPAFDQLTRQEMRDLLDYLAGMRGETL